jgi:hypothetical protein
MRKKPAAPSATIISLTLRITQPSNLHRSVEWRTFSVRVSVLLLSCCLLLLLSTPFKFAQAFLLAPGALRLRSLSSVARVCLFFMAPMNFYLLLP